MREHIFLEPNAETYDISNEENSEGFTSFCDDPHHRVFIMSARVALVDLDFSRIKYKKTTYIGVGHLQKGFEGQVVRICRLWWHAGFRYGV